jgi:hypothetical protein
MLVTFILSLTGCIAFFLLILGVTVTLPSPGLIRFFQHFFPETEGCTGWKDFGFNRKQQIRQCIMIPVCCLIAALICTFL